MTRAEHPPENDSKQQAEAQGFEIGQNQDLIVKDADGEIVFDPSLYEKPGDTSDEDWRAELERKSEMAQGYVQGVETDGFTLSEAADHDRQVARDAKIDRYAAKLAKRTHYVRNAQGKREEGPLYSAAEARAEAERIVAEQEASAADAERYEAHWKDLDEKGELPDDAREPAPSSVDQSQATQPEVPEPASAEQEIALEEIDGILKNLSERFAKLSPRWETYPGEVLAAVGAVAETIKILNHNLALLEAAISKMDAQEAKAAGTEADGAQPPAAETTPPAEAPPAAETQPGAQEGTQAENSQAEQDAEADSAGQQEGQETDAERERQEANFRKRLYSVARELSARMHQHKESDKLFTDEFRQIVVRELKNIMPRPTEMSEDDYDALVERAAIMEGADTLADMDRVDELLAGKPFKKQRRILKKELKQYRQFRRRFESGLDVEIRDTRRKLEGNPLTAGAFRDFMDLFAKSSQASLSEEEIAAAQAARENLIISSNGLFQKFDSLQTVKETELEMRDAVIKEMNERLGQLKKRLKHEKRGRGLLDIFGKQSSTGKDREGEL